MVCIPFAEHLQRQLPLLLASTLLVLSACGSGSSGGDSSAASCPIEDTTADTDNYALYSHQVVRALSSDGNNFELDATVLIDHASVPEAVIGSDGTVWVYYVNGIPGKHGIYVASEQPDGSFAERSCVFIDGALQGGAVDPDVVKLDDGSYRLYYYHGVDPNVVGFNKTGIEPMLQGVGGQPSMHEFYAAASSDGIHFSVLGKVFEHETATDPTVVRTADGNWLLAMACSEAICIASSSDGLQFSQIETIYQPAIPELFLMPDGMVRLVAGNRAYLSSDNGVSWGDDTGFRASRNGLVEYLLDPSLIKVGENYQLFHKVFAE